MTATYGIISLVAVVICTNFQDGLTNTRAEVESKLICTSKWQKLKLNSKSMVTHLSSKQNFSSFWRENEQDFKARTAKRLFQAVIYPYNFTKDFSCYGTVANYAGSIATWVNNVSVNITLPEVGSELLGLRLIPLSGGERRLEFYVRPTTNIGEVSYSLSYCYVNKYDPGLAENYSCPVFRNVIFSCSLRESNVYGIPNSSGLICQAFTTDYINYYADYKFYIQSTTGDGSNSVSTDFRIYTKQSVDNVDEPISHYQGYFTAVLMGPKPRYLIIAAIEQKVVLNWENTKFTMFHQIDYSCSNGANSSKTSKEASASIHDANFAPYILCEFCLTNLVSAGSLRSEPLCNSTRFPEKSPSMPPSITCDFKTCGTTSYANDTRAVKVNCELPKENTRNGLLTSLVINYWNQSNTDPFRKDFPINLTSCQVTVKGLHKRQNYFAQMSVCNSQGCSSLSETVLIAKAVHPPSRNQNGKKLYWLGFLAVLPVPIIGGFVCYYSRRTTKPKQNKSLPNVKELIANCYCDLEASNNYHELPNGDGNGNELDNI
ncbi:receptor-type tyrosine- phosphatase S-like [Paramuricea clavata]|uniref:Receptor-type tyrosine- phosphatase S-like n=1 Tax=Paramuricea clavata TaxID=317549 RepID=A0A6S7LBT5_PARCT|nr:receptor-type tyrosine- phosphatase S-like [Paramuricea clavata]